MSNIIESFVRFKNRPRWISSDRTTGNPTRWRDGEEASRRASSSPASIKYLRVHKTTDRARHGYNLINIAYTWAMYRWGTYYNNILYNRQKSVVEKAKTIVLLMNNRT